MAKEIPQKVRKAMVRGDSFELKRLARRGAAVAMFRKKKRHRKLELAEAERLRQERMGIA